MARRSTAKLTVAAAVLAFTAFPGQAAAAPAPSPVRVLATGLDDPAGLRFRDGRLLVTEMGTGEVTAVARRGGAQTTLVPELPGVVSADVSGDRLLLLTGAHAPTPGTIGDATLFTADRRGGALTPLADLEEYELAHNPDGQRQFGDSGEPLDALSNPFAVLAGRGRTYAFVAEGGANAGFAVDRRGTVRTFFVPPVRTTRPFKCRPNKGPSHAVCDSGPTGPAFGPGRTLYVSTLSGDAHGEGRIYVLDDWTGEVLRVIRGLTAPTGVTVDGEGVVYVSELTEGAPEGDPPPGFDPSTVGRIVRIDCDDRRSYAQVTMPLGLHWHGGALYSTAWSVAGMFLGQEHAGQVVQVPRSAFTAAA